MLDRFIISFGVPINGTLLGSVTGLDVGVNVQKIKSPDSVYLYLIAFWFVFVKF